MMTSIASKAKNQMRRSVRGPQRWTVSLLAVSAACAIHSSQSFTATAGAIPDVNIADLRAAAVCRGLSSVAINGSALDCSCDSPPFTGALGVVTQIAVTFSAYARKHDDLNGSPDTDAGDSIEAAIDFGASTNADIELAEGLSAGAGAAFSAIALVATSAYRRSELRKAVVKIDDDVQCLAQIGIVWTERWRMRAKAFAKDSQNAVVDGAPVVAAVATAAAELAAADQEILATQAQRAIRAFAAAHGELRAGADDLGGPKDKHLAERVRKIGECNAWAIGEPVDDECQKLVFEADQRREASSCRVEPETETQGANSTVAALAGGKKVEKKCKTSKTSS